MRKLLVAASIAYAVFVVMSAVMAIVLPDSVEVSSGATGAAAGGVLSQEVRILIMGWAVAMDIFVGLVGLGLVKRLVKCRKRQTLVTGQP